LVQGLLFIAQNLNNGNDSPALRMSSFDVLAPFKEAQEKFSWPQGSPFTNLPYDQERSLHGLLRRLLRYSYGSDRLIRRPPSKLQAIINTKLYSSVVGTTGSNEFGNFDPLKMCETLSASKAFANAKIGPLEIATLAIEMMKCLPLGTLPDLV
jgi:hypothetical protein